MAKRSFQTNRHHLQTSTESVDSRPFSIHRSGHNQSDFVIWKWTNNICGRLIVNKWLNRYNSANGDSGCSRTRWPEWARTNLMDLIIYVDLLERFWEMCANPFIVWKCEWENAQRYFPKKTNNFQWKSTENMLFLGEMAVVRGMSGSSEIWKGFGKKRLACSICDLMTLESVLHQWLPPPLEVRQIDEIQRFNIQFSLVTSGHKTGSSPFDGQTFI